MRKYLCVVLVFVLAGLLALVAAVPKAAVEKFAAREITTERLVVAKPGGKYRLEVAVTNHWAGIEIHDSTGRILVVDLDDWEGGLVLYSKDGKHLIGLGQVGDNQPMLAVVDPETKTDGGFAIFPRGRNEPLPAAKAVHKLRGR